MESDQDNETEIMQKLAELPGRNMKCDLLLEVGDQSFPARKDVLILRMEYFRNMFNADMQEKDKIIIELDPEIVDPTVFDELLDYVYTLNIEFTNDNLQSIYKAADFFCFDELKTKTESFMKNNLNKENVSLLSEIAMRFDLKAQEEECKQFIITNPLPVSKPLYGVGFLNFNQLSTFLQNLRDINKLEDMFNSSIEWILYDKQSRSKRISEILQLIPLGRLSSDFYEQVISKNTIVMNDNKCLRLLFRSIIVGYNPPIEELYVFGGRDESTLSSMSKYDSSTQQWSELSPMPQKMTHFACCVVNQKIYVGGGWNDQKYMNELYMFNPSTRQWNTLNTMKHPRQACAMAVLNGHLYVAGGCGGNYLSIVERFSIQDYEWSTVSPMIHKRSGLELVQMNGFLYALGGGEGANYLQSVEQYNPLTNKWTLIANMNFAYAYFGSAVLNNCIYVVGKDSCEEYNPEEDQWRIMPSPTECERGRCSAVIDGKLYAIGGGISDDFNSKGMKTVEYYHFEKRSWIAGKDMNIARCYHGLAVVTRKNTNTPA